MAGMKQPIQSIKTKLQSEQVTNGDGTLVTPYVSVWNNQRDRMRAGETFAFALPAFFVEPMSPITWASVGQGVRAANVTFRIHILHEFRNASDGSMDEDLVIFDLRDNIIHLLQQFRPTGGGILDGVGETFDYDHDNIYDLMLDFTCEIKDTKGSPYDPDRPGYIYKQPPTDLELEVTTAMGGISNNLNFNIPQNK